MRKRGALPARYGDQAREELEGEEKEKKKKRRRRAEKRETSLLTASYL